MREGKEVDAGLGGGTLCPLRQWGMKEVICKGRESCNLGGDSRVVIWATEMNWTEYVRKNTSCVVRGGDVEGLKRVKLW